MTAWCSTFSPCSPTTWLGKSVTISQTCSRSPNKSSFVSVQHVEQLDSYIMQLPCWYYSPSVKPSRIPMNIPYDKADLASLLLWMCPHTCQDQFNLHKKGMTPVDMRLLLLSLKAFERICTKKDPIHNPMRRLLTRARRETRGLVPSLWARLPRKLAPRSILTSARSMGACIPCTIPRIVVGTRKTGWSNPIFTPPRKAERNPTPPRTFLQSWARRWTGLRRQSRNKTPNRRNVVVVIVILTQNRVLVWVA